MHFFDFIIFYFILIAKSAPITTSIAPSHIPSSHTSSSTKPFLPIQPTHAFSHSIPTFPSVTLPAVLPSHTRPLYHPSNSPSNTNAPHQQTSQKRILIAFGVLGGLVASIFLLGLLHCCYKYKKAPKRDRIAEVLSRHHLQRELDELERNPHILRHPSLREPAPPYLPSPPSYDVVTSTPTITGVHQTTYTDMHNLSSSPFLPSYLPSQPNSRRPPDSIP